MKKLPIVLDLETQHSFRQYSNPQDLKVSVVGIYDYKDQAGKVFREKDLNRLFPILERASYIIGYNISHFDLPVLQRYYPGDVSQFAVFDILKEIKEKVGRRLSLDEVVFATLKKKKSGHGLLAIDYYRERNWQALESYCLDDVLLTKELFEYGVDQGKIFYLEGTDKVSIKVDWRRYLDHSGNKNISLTLPF